MSTRPEPPPTLLVVFHRPEVTRRLVDALRPAAPSRVYVAGDGPRAGHPDDVERVAATRAAIAGIDWPCDVRTRYLDENVGLQRNVVGAIDWFFEHEDAGVILEDDCLPAPDLLPFAASVLERYADEPQVMHVSGLNMRPEPRRTPHSYFFAEVGHVWGWATWRRAWRRFDPELRVWPELAPSLGPGAPRLRRMIGRKLASAHAGRKWTWSRAWYGATVAHHGLAVIPAVNLVENVGDGPDATHGPTPGHPLRRPAEGRLTFPLHHPAHLVPDPGYERLLAEYHAGTYRRRIEDGARELRARLTPREAQHRGGDAHPRSGPDQR